MTYLAEAVVASVTIITSESLWLAGVIDKRNREDDVDLKLAPFMPHATASCFICGAPQTKTTGPFPAKACTDSKRCPARAIPHLHVQCNTCKGSYLMEAAPRS